MQSRRGPDRGSVERAGEEITLKRGIVVLAVATFFAAAGRPKDAKDVVNDVARTIGATDLNSIQY